MATFEIEGPDGKLYEVEAPNAQAAAAAFQRSAGKASLNWSDVPGQALDNVGSSATNFVRSVVYPFMHPIETAKAFKDIGSGLVSKAQGGLGFEQDPKEKVEREAAADAVGAFYKDRFGGSENIKRTLATDPVGAFADAALVLTGAGGALARAPGAVGKAGQVVSKTGRAIDPLAATARVAAPVARGVGRAAAAGLGVTTGTGATPIVNAFKAGREGNRAFIDNMRGNVAPEAAVDMAERAVGAMGQARGNAYKTGMSGVDQTAQADLAYRPVQQARTDAFGSVYYNGVAKSKAAEDTLKALEDKLLEFHNTGGAWNSVAGLDALKQSFGEIRQATRQGTLERRIASKYYQAVKKAIVDAAPDYARVMDDYSRASDQISEARRTLSVNDRAAADTTLRKLQSTQRNNVNANFGARARLLDELARYEPDLPATLAGQSMADWAPRGLARVTGGLAGIHGATSLNPLVLAMLPFQSPRIVGEGAYLAGRSMTGASDAGNVLTKYVDAPTIQSGILNAYLAGELADQSQRR